MNEKEFIFKSTFAAIGTAITAWCGGWDIALKVLVYLMVLDYITGFLGAVRQKKVNSEVMFWGGIRKIVILSLVALAVLLDKLFGNSGPVLRTMAMYYYAGREGISMIENVGKIGLKMPPKFKSIFQQLQEKGD
ncbi:holin family protein [Desulfosporosinus acididurans]|uniref:Holin family protein n=1 Tax=Desulfosporosinus acididurans TaxID=476652 RepID=A0A0J1FKS9_9FIRM|nr:phage holin family protein [Desulfosporosinus acididurans]KLU64002.1 holin family protein [Desulfosporosinus acididurans]